MLGIHCGRPIGIIIRISVDTSIENRFSRVVVGTAVNTVRRCIIGRQQTQRTEIFANVRFEYSTGWRKR